MIDTTKENNMTERPTLLDITDIARVVHEANRALQVVLNDPTIPPSPPWDQVGEDTRASCIYGVEMALRGVTPEQMHTEWMKDRLYQGWRYGKVKDPVSMTHPCLVPYRDLSAGDRAKDALFLAVVSALAGLAQ